MSTDPRVATEQALVYASMCGQVDVVRFLLDQDIDINAKPPGTHSAVTALHAAVWQGDEAMVRFLLERGADHTIRDERYDATPLEWAEYGGQGNVADLLR
jgi:ankyrin repeat protein